MGNELIFVDMEKKIFDSMTKIEKRAFLVNRLSQINNVDYTGFSVKKLIDILKQVETDFFDNCLD